MPKEIINKALAFIGKKFDEIVSAIKGQKLDVDMSDVSRRLEQIKDVILTQTTDLARAYPNEKDLNKLSEAARQLQSATEMLQSKEELNTLVSTLEGISSNNQEVTEILTNKQEEFKQTILSQTEILVEILNKKQDVKEIKELNLAIKGVQKAVKEIKLEQKDIDFSPINIAIKTVFTTLENTFTTSNDSIKDVLKNEFRSLREGFVKAIEANKPITTFKLDAMQIRALKPQANYQGPIPARNPIITRVTMTSSDTEYSHTFNKNTVMWRMKLEAQDASFNYAWATGKLKVSGDASAYISIPTNWLDSRDNSEYGTKTIYFESGTASQKMEIEEGIS